MRQGMTGHLKSKRTDGNVPQILDPSIQSLAYVHILHAHIEAARAASKLPRRNLAPAALLGGRLWPRIVALLQGFDPIQVRYAGNQFRFIVEVVSYGVRQTGHVSRFLVLIVLEKAADSMSATASDPSSSKRYSPS
jgi:hypothetical protein